MFWEGKKTIASPQDHTGPRTIQQLKGNLRLYAHFFLPIDSELALIKLVRLLRRAENASEKITDDAQEASERSEKEQKERGVRSHSRVQKVQ